jgi:hypothetical protein
MTAAAWIRLTLSAGDAVILPGSQPPSRIQESLALVVALFIHGNGVKRTRGTEVATGDKFAAKPVNPKYLVEHLEQYQGQRGLPLLSPHECTGALFEAEI